MPGIFLNLAGSLSFHIRATSSDRRNIFDEEEMNFAKKRFATECYAYQT